MTMQAFYEICQCVQRITKLQLFHDVFPSLIQLLKSLVSCCIICLPAHLFPAAEEHHPEAHSLLAEHDVPAEQVPAILHGTESY